jgi:hypothetical protein
METAGPKARGSHHEHFVGSYTILNGLHARVVRLSPRSSLTIYAPDSLPEVSDYWQTASTTPETSPDGHVPFLLLNVRTTTLESDLII